MDQRLRRVRLVTARFSELKGLHVAYAGTLWVTFGIALYAQRDVTAWTLLTGFAGVVAAYLPGKWWLDRYYRHRFGRIVVSPLRTSRVLWLIPALVAIAIGSKVFAVGPLGGACLVVSAESLWVAIRDWPSRGHYLIGGVAAALAGSVQFASHSSFLSFGHAEAVGVAIMGLSYIPLGLLDHRLLTSVMQGAEAGEVRQE